VARLWPDEAEVCCAGTLGVELTSRRRPRRSAGDRGVGRTSRHVRGAAVGASTRLRDSDGSEVAKAASDGRS